MAMSGASAMSDSTNAATDHPRLPLSERRASLRRKVLPARASAMSRSAPVSETLPAALALGRHEGGDRLLRQALIGILERIGEGVGRVDHGLHQLRAGQRQGASLHRRTAVMLRCGDQRDRHAFVGAKAGTAERIIFDLARLSLIHISEPTRLGMISYAVFCLKKK